MDESTNYDGMKLETVIEETILEETPLESDDARRVGQEGSTYINEFTICRLKYRGQTSDPSVDKSIIQSSSVEEFCDNLYHLVRPFIQRTIEFPTPEVPFWAAKEFPTREDLPLYVAFKDKIQKRTWRMESVDEHMLLKWSSRVLVLQVYIYSANIQCRAMWDLVTQYLLSTPAADGAPPAVKKPAELVEEDRLEVFIKKLKKIHQAYLVPKTRNAYKLWAQMIMSKPVKKHRELWFNRPPKGLMDNFAIVGKNENRKRAARRVNVSDDGFRFEDEVNALRQTVTQIKDLVEMLDRRVELLEDKCQGLRQEVPFKRSRFDDDDDDDEEDDDQSGEDNEEPAIDVPSKDEKSPGGESHSGKPDPLLFNDLVKLEYDDSGTDD